MPAGGISPKLDTWGSQPSDADTLHTPPALGVASGHLSLQVSTATSSGITGFFIYLYLYFHNMYQRREVGFETNFPDHVHLSPRFLSSGC